MSPQDTVKEIARKVFRWVKKYHTSVKNAYTKLDWLDRNASCTPHQFNSRWVRPQMQF